MELLKKKENRKEKPFYALFKNKGFVLFLITCFFLYLLSQFYYIAQVAMVVELTNSTIILGTVLMIMAIPRIIILPIGGVLTDKLNEKKLLFIGYASLTIILTTLGIIVISNNLSINIVITFAILFGISSAAILPATYSIIPKLVDETLLQKANALVQFLNQFSFFIGAAIAGILLGAFELSTFIFILSVLMVVSLITLTRIYIPDKMSNQIGNSEENEDESKIKGFITILKNRKVLMLIIFTCLLNLSVIGPQQVGLPVLAESKYGLMTDGLSYLLSAFGLGSLIGVIIAGLLPSKYNSVSFMSLMAMTFGVIWFVFTWVNNIYFILSLLCFAGILISIINILFITTLQKSSPINTHGKLMSLVFMGSTGLQPVSHFLTGLIISVYSLKSMYAFAGLIVVKFSIFIFIREYMNKNKTKRIKSKIHS